MNDLIKIESRSLAEEFLDELVARKDLPAPEVSVDPDGEIVFDWFGNPYYMFSVSFGDNKLTYAGLYDKDRVYGEIEYNGKIPLLIIQNIERVYKR